MPANIHYVDLVRAEPNANVLVARVIWRGEGACEVLGDDPVAVELRDEVIDPFGKTHAPADGYDFLRAVSQTYRSAYLLASAIQEGEPTPAEFG